MISTCLYNVSQEKPETRSAGIKDKLVLITFLDFDETFFVLYRCTEEDLDKIQRYHNLFCGEAHNIYDNEMWEFFYSDEGDFKFEKIYTPITFENIDLAIISGIC